MRYYVIIFLKTLAIVAFFAMMLVFLMGGPGHFVQDPHSAIFRERLFSNSFDIKTGEHVAVRDSVLSSIYAPETYNHIVTNKYDIYIDTIGIAMIYVAKDSSGKLSEFHAEAIVSIDGKITKLTVSKK